MSIEWRPVEGFPGYLVNAQGQIKAEARTIECKTKGGVMCTKHYKEKLMTPTLGLRGYYVVNVRNEGKIKSMYVHRAIAQAFIKNPNNHKIVDHIDCDRKNNAINNLRWVSATENCLNRKTPSRTGQHYIQVYYKVSVPGHTVKCVDSLESAIELRDELLAQIKSAP